MLPLLSRSTAPQPVPAILPRFALKAWLKGGAVAKALSQNTQTAPAASVPAVIVSVNIGVVELASYIVIVQLAKFTGELLTFVISTYSSPEPGGSDATSVTRIAEEGTGAVGASSTGAVGTTSIRLTLSKS